MKQLQVRDQGAVENSSTRLIPMTREYAVFNVDQCEDLPDSTNTGKSMRVRNPDMRDGLADAFLHLTGADIRTIRTSSTETPLTRIFDNQTRETSCGLDRKKQFDHTSDYNARNGLGSEVAVLDRHVRSTLRIRRHQTTPASPNRACQWATPQIWA